VAGSSTELSRGPPGLVLSAPRSDFEGAYYALSYGNDGVTPIHRLLLSCG